MYVWFIERRFSEPLKISFSSGSSTVLLQRNVFTLERVNKNSMLNKKDLKCPPDKVPFPCYGYTCTPFPVHSQTSCFFLIRVFIDYQGKPHIVYFLISQSIEGGFCLQIVVSQSIVDPFQNYFKLEVNCGITFSSLVVTSTLTGIISEYSLERGGIFLL